MVLPSPEAQLLVPASAAATEPLPGGTHTLVREVGTTPGGRTFAITVKSGHLSSKLRALREHADMQPGGRDAHSLCLAWQASLLHLSILGSSNVHQLKVRLDRGKVAQQAHPPCFELVHLPSKSTWCLPSFCFACCRRARLAVWGLACCWTINFPMPPNAYAAAAVSHLSPTLSQLVQDSMAGMPSPMAAVLLPDGASAEPLPGGEHSLGRAGQGTQTGLNITGSLLAAKIRALTDARSRVVAHCTCQVMRHR